MYVIFRLLRKTRRGRPRQNVLKKFKLMFNNLHGVKSKLTPIKEIMEYESPAILGLAETKLEEGEIIKLEGYEIERVDREEEGGVLIAYKKCLKNVMQIVREEKEDCEMLWMKLDNGKIAIRIGVVYMPQENKTKLDVIKNIYKKIEEEIERAIRNGERVVLMGDSNCKVGKEIEGNTDEVSKGGKILIKLKKQNGINDHKCRKMLHRKVDKS